MGRPATPRHGCRSCHRPSCHQSARGRERGGFPGWPLLGAPRPSPSFRPGRVGPARLRAPTHAGSAAQTFLPPLRLLLLSRSSLVWVCFFSSPQPWLASPHPARAATGQGWNRRHQFWGQKSLTLQTSVAARLLLRTEPPATQPAATGARHPRRGRAVAWDKNIPTEVEKGRGKASRGGRERLGVQRNESRTSRAPSKAAPGDKAHAEARPRAEAPGPQGCGEG